MQNFCNSSIFHQSLVQLRCRETFYNKTRRGHLKHLLFISFESIFELEEQLYAVIFTRYLYQVALTWYNKKIILLNLNILCQNWVLVTVKEPTLTHHFYPKVIVYIRIHSWCCTFCGFWQKYNDIYPLLYYQASRTVSLPWKSSVLCQFTLPLP